VKSLTKNLDLSVQKCKKVSLRKRTCLVGGELFGAVTENQKSSFESGEN